MILITDAFSVVITIFIVLATCGLIFGLFLLIRRIERKWKEESDVLVEDFIPKNEMKSVVETYIERVGVFGSFSMFLIDIDDYSGLKESVGVGETNNILKELAKRITKVFPRTSAISRYGSDRILVLNKTEVKYVEIEEFSMALMDLLREPFELSRGEKLTISSSVGIALFPTCGSSYKELLQSVELATYVAKRDGGNQYIVYHSDMEETESSNMEYFKEVRRAMENKEFCLYYQPIIDMKDKKIFGFETFLRWNHPEHGVLTPQKFINVLERSGDINYVSKWGIEQIAKMLVEIQNKAKENDICMTVNLSTKQLMNDSIVEDFKKIIHKYKVSPNKIVLEVGEYAMYEKLDIVRINLLRLRDLGFKISVDGLGLDYATLSQIEKEPIDILKLDKEFLENTSNNYVKEKFVGMLVESAAEMNRIVIAEGIEDYNHINYVLSNSISYGQGYYLSMPFEEEKVLRYIESNEFLRV